MGYTHTSAIGCQTITVMSLTLCGSIIALINPVRALTCSAGHLVVIYSEVPCNSPNAGNPHPKSANTMQPGRLRSVFQSVRKYGGNAVEGGKPLPVVHQYYFGSSLPTHIHPPCPTLLNPIHFVLLYIKSLDFSFIKTSR